MFILEVSVLSHSVGKYRLLNVDAYIAYKYVINVLPFHSIVCMRFIGGGGAIPPSMHLFGYIFHAQPCAQRQKITTLYIICSLSMIFRLENFVLFWITKKCSKVIFYIFVLRKFNLKHN